MGIIEDRIRASQMRKNGGTPTLTKRERQKGTAYLNSQATHSSGWASDAMAAASQMKESNDRALGSMEEWEISDAFTKLKYIVIDHPQIGEIAITFPGCFVHREMSQTRRVREGRIVAAGFYNIMVNDDEVVIRPYGRSESLNVDSRPFDGAIIARSMGLGEFLAD